MLRPDNDRNGQDQRKPELIPKHTRRVPGVLVVAAVFSATTMPGVLVVALNFWMLRIAGLCRGRMVIPVKVRVLVMLRMLVMRHSGVIYMPVRGCSVRCRLWE